MKNQDIAIIGNAYSIIGKNQGKTIDKFNIVIRINSDVPKNKNDIGEKTSFYYSGDILYRKKDLESEYLKSGTNYEVPVIYKNLFLWKQCQNFYDPINEKSTFNNRKPPRGVSTGLLCIFDMLLRKPKSITCYGFDGWVTPDKKDALRVVNWGNGVYDCSDLNCDYVKSERKRIKLLKKDYGVTFK